MKKIITIPHPTLRMESKLVTNVDKKLTSFISDLGKTLSSKRNPKGVGLAAPQVNKLWRIFATNIDQLKIYINPRIIKMSQEISLGPDKDDPIMEGCLSMPELYGPVPRNTWIDVEYQYIDGEKLSNKKVRLEDFSARVFQHELDHLNGILFTDYSLKYNLPVYKETGKNKYEEVDPELLKIF